MMRMIMMMMTIMMDDDGGRWRTMDGWMRMDEDG